MQASDMSCVRNVKAMHKRCSLAALAAFPKRAPISAVVNISLQRELRLNNGETATSSLELFDLLNLSQAELKGSL